MSEELKPCPFCGCKATVSFIYKSTFFIGCENGCAKTKNYSIRIRKEPLKTYEKSEKMKWATDEWNRRAT